MGRIFRSEDLIRTGDASIWGAKFRISPDVRLERSSRVVKRKWVPEAARLRFAGGLVMEFEVAPDTDFAAAKRFLDGEGIRNELRKDPFPGTPECLTLTDPKGTQLDLFKTWDFLTGNQNVSGIGPLKVGHIAFFCPDVQGMVKWYERVLGFRVSDWLGDFFVFMRCNPDHHTEIGRAHV